MPILPTWKTMMGFALMIFGAAAAAHARADLWLHIKVRDANEGSKVALDLPLAVVEAAMPLLPADARFSGSLRVGDRDLTVADLRVLWHELAQHPDATYLTVQGSDGKVRIGRESNHLVIRATDQSAHHGEHIDLRLPAPVVDALLTGSDNQLNMAAAMAALARTGEGDLVTVNSHHETVHMWVDAVSDGGR